jgi:hypothetical protein
MITWITLMLTCPSVYACNMYEYVVHLMTEGFKNPLVNFHSYYRQPKVTQLVFSHKRILKLKANTDKNCVLSTKFSKGQEPSILNSIRNV